MLGGNNGNPVLPVFLDETQFRYQTNAANQLQLFGNREFSHLGHVMIRLLVRCCCYIGYLFFVLLNLFFCLSKFVCFTAFKVTCCYFPLLEF